MIINNDPFFSLSYNKISNNLFLSNYVCAANDDFIKSNNIKVVINCSKDLIRPEFYDKYNIKFMRIPIDDSRAFEETKTFYKYLDSAIDLIKKSKKNNLNILVHCYTGIQRSATLVLCYIMNEINEFIDNDNTFVKNNDLNNKMEGLSLNNIIGFLKSKRDIVFYREPTFIILINDYYNKHILNKLVN